MVERPAVELMLGVERSWRGYWIDHAEVGCAHVAKIYHVMVGVARADEIVLVTTDVDRVAWLYHLMVDAARVGQMHLASNRLLDAGKALEGEETTGAGTRLSHRLIASEEYVPAFCRDWIAFGRACPVVP